MAGALTLHIQRISNEVLRVEEGSLYPALHRMEQEGWIAAEWGLSENNRRARFYRLTAQGRKQLRAERENWQKITQAVALVLDFGPASGLGALHGMDLASSRTLSQEQAR